MFTVDGVDTKIFHIPKKRKVKNENISIRPYIVNIVFVSQEP